MSSEFCNTVKELRSFLLLWSTQSLSALGSAMTNFALILWAYEQSGSALATSLLAVCSYAPYVLLSIFAGALSDRWNKKRTILASDTFAALCALAVLVLLGSGLAGARSCLPFRADKHIRALERPEAPTPEEKSRP